MKIYIKNMVCDRCIMVVRTTFEEFGWPIRSISLGEVEIENELSETDKEGLNNRLKALGFSLIDDYKSRINEQIKNTLIELVYQKNNRLGMKLSDYLSDKFRQDYRSLSTLFSGIEGIAIEKYYISLRIERVKELLAYDELTLGEISYLMNYSSIAHLSSQFKKETGLTPSHFKQIGINRRRRALNKL